MACRQYYTRKSAAFPHPGTAERHAPPLETGSESAARFRSPSPSIWIFRKKSGKLLGMGASGSAAARVSSRAEAIRSTLRYTPSPPAATWIIPVSRNSSGLSGLGKNRRIRPGQRFRQVVMPHSVIREYLRRPAVHPADLGILRKTGGPGRGHTHDTGRPKADYSPFI